MRILAVLLVVLLWNAIAGAKGKAPLQIDGNFPGGNIVVDAIEGDAVFLHQDLRDTKGDWFYWCFRVRGATGRTLTFHFTKGDVIAAMGPACSTDGGKTWKWLGREIVKAATQPGRPVPDSRDAKDAKPAQGPSFAYRFPADAEEVRFCLAIPYLEPNLKEFLAGYRKRPELKVATLCKTKKGRDAEVLYLGRPDGKGDYRIAFTCRHHACEMMAGYVLEGIMESVLSDDENGKWFRGHVAILAVPFMDKDGVEEGDQGKNRHPHDHNRDYAGDSIYPTVAAVKKLIPEWSGGKLDVAIDLHCPSRGDNFIHFVGGPNQESWQRVERLCEILHRVQKGPLTYAAKDNVPFGKGWNKSTGDLMSFSRWAGGLPGIFISTTIETPYASVKGKPVTVESARAFGHDVAAALRQFLETELPRQKNAP